MSSNMSDPCWKCQDNIPVSSHEGMVFAFPLSENWRARQLSPRGVGKLPANLVWIPQGWREFLDTLLGCIHVSHIPGGIFPRLDFALLFATGFVSQEIHLILQMFCALGCASGVLEPVEFSMSLLWGERRKSIIAALSQSLILQFQQKGWNTWEAAVKDANPRCPVVGEEFQALGWWNKTTC